jgi:hypothetical protein
MFPVTALPSDVDDPVVVSPEVTPVVADVVDDESPVVEPLEAVEPVEAVVASPTPERGLPQAVAISATPIEKPLPVHPTVSRLASHGPVIEVVKQRSRGVLQTRRNESAITHDVEMQHSACRRILSLDGKIGATANSPESDVFRGAPPV